MEKKDLKTVTIGEISLELTPVEGGEMADLFYSFSDGMCELIEKESNKDLKERILKNVSDLHEIVGELVKREQE